MFTFLNFVVVPIILLVILILVHELGHFLAAKKTGVYVEEFGFGIPPRLFGIKWGETLYSLNALPLGGFVRLFGEDKDQSQEQKKIPQSRAFYAQNAWAKTFIITAGVVMNLLLAIVIFSVSYSFTGIPKETQNVQIVEIAPNSPAEQAGLKTGDKILKIKSIFNQKELTVIKWDGVISPDLIQNAVEVDTLEKFSKYTQEHKGDLIAVQVERQQDKKNSQQLWLSFVPRIKYPADQGPTGVTISNYQNIFYPWWQMPFRGTWAGIQEAFAWLGLIVVSLGQMFYQLFTTGNAPEVGGPVAIFQVSGQVAQLGILATLRFMGILSVNLAVLNILPLPALDGGRLVFIIWEGVTRKKVNAKFEYWTNSLGMLSLIALLLLITYNDIIRIFGNSWLFTQIKNLFP